MYGFIFGGAGSGKSSWIYRHLTEEALRHPEKRYYLFVPEQNTLRAQQELIRVSPRHGLLNLDVLSFQLLAYRVMEELGIRKPDILDEMSKSVLLRAACRSQAAKLSVYGKKLDQAGFIAQLKSAFSEFYQYEMTPELLEALSQKSENQILSAKLSDLALIFADYRNRLCETETVMEEIPFLLLKQLHRSALLSGAELFFDGYTGFTPVQLEILSHLMTQAESLRFALTVPADADPYRRAASPGGISELYWLSRETVAKLCALGEKNGILRAEDIVCTGAYTNPKTEAFLLHDPEEEAAFCAKRIAALRGSVPYREISVAVSEPESYREALKRAFLRAKIPYFIDDQADGRSSMLAGLLRSVLDVIEEGYSYEPVMRYLRNPLVKGEREQKDLADNYIRALGIRGRKGYETEWERIPKGQEFLDIPALNAYKEAALAPVLRLHDEMKNGDRTAAARISALSGFLAAAEAEEQLSAVCGSLSAAGFLTEAEENARFLPLIRTFFERMERVLGGEKLSLRDFAALLDAGFTELRAGMVPEVMDRVVIGDLKRSRFDGIKVLFLLGANDGLLPSVVSGGGIFTDAEREELLREHEAELAPPDRLDSCIQRFYLHLTMKKPGRLCCLSLSKNDMQGRSLKPSVVLRDLQEEAALRGAPFRIEEAHAEGIDSLPDAALYLAEAFSAGEYRDQKVQTVYNYLRRRKDADGTAERLLYASLYRHRPERLSAETARALYGETLYGSVTRLEQYARCPYAHFLRYGLRLSERQQYEIAALDIGNLYHGAIDLAFRELEAAKTTLSALSDEALSALSARCVEAVSSEYQNRIMQSSARNRWILSQVGRITGRTLWALRAQLAKGDFRPLGCEIPFRFDTPGLSLHGRIDRVDVCEDASKVYVKVIDYKSGRTKFDLSMVWHGLQLQLVTYMNIALRKMGEQFSGSGKTPAPAGIFYYHIEDPVTDYTAGLGGEGLSEALLGKLRMNGLSSEDSAAIRHMDRTLYETDTAESSVIPVKRKAGAVQARGSATAKEEFLLDLSRYAAEKLQEMSEEILGGRIEAMPYRKGQTEGCDFCPYHSVCGFDRRMKGYTYRTIPAVSGEKAEETLSERYHRNEKKGRQPD